MSDPARRSDTFLRGLMTGAVVGAVIAGSTLWERRRRAASSAADGPAMETGAPVQSGSWPKDEPRDPDEPATGDLRP